MEEVYYGLDQTDNTVYKVTLQWEVDEAGVKTGRPDVIVEPIAEFERRDNAKAFVRAWNQDTGPD